VFNKDQLYGSFVLDKINIINPDLIVLAGFLLKFPDHIIKEYSNKIVNIHPALLPNYGGKGMYGKHVHQAVLDNKEKETGISIHFVNENYDEGGIIFQKSVNIENCATPEEIAEKVHELEHKYFPEVIEKLLTHNL
jgi:phosphoribosylglycinamide formyltransferase-1